MDVAHLGIDDPRWPAALARIRHDFYHLPEYAALESNSHHAQPKAFLATDGNRELFIPYLLRPCDDTLATGQVYDVVSPYGYPGFLLSDAARESSEFVREAVHGLTETLRAQGVCSAFLRMNPLLSDGFPALFPEDFFSPASDTVAVDLALDESQMWEGTRHGHQWVITKCRKLGFVPRMVPFHEHIETFMAVYQETMDRVKARDSYYFGRDYFEKLAGMPERVHCCLIESEGEAAAACLVFECGGIVQAHLGGTKTKFMKQSPFHLVLYHLALWAKSRGNHFFHLGGGVGGSGDRLLDFKRGFSERIFPFYTVRLITDDEKYRALTTLHAQSRNVAVEDLINSDYFPAYRTPS